VLHASLRKKTNDGISNSAWPTFRQVSLHCVIRAQLHAKRQPSQPEKGSPQLETFLLLTNNQKKGRRTIID
jgi:hypothetical protein